MVLATVARVGGTLWGHACTRPVVAGSPGVCRCEVHLKAHVLGIGYLMYSSPYTTQHPLVHMTTIDQLPTMVVSSHAYPQLPMIFFFCHFCLPGDVVSRMAVVPMGQEARGLDAGSRLAERLVGLGDSRSARIVARIAEEERAHVAVGMAEECGVWTSV